MKQFIYLLLVLITLISSCAKHSSDNKIYQQDKMPSIESKQEYRFHQNEKLKLGIISKDQYNDRLVKIDKSGLPEQIERELDKEKIIRTYEDYAANNPVCSLIRQYNEGSITKAQLNTGINKIMDQLKRDRIRHEQYMIASMQMRQQEAIARGNQDAIRDAALIQASAYDRAAYQQADAQRMSAAMNNLPKINNSIPNLSQPRYNNPPQPQSYDIYDSSGTQQLGTLRPTGGIMPIGGWGN